MDKLFIPGPAGKIELLTDLDVGDKSSPAAVAIICHPHPLFQGTMHNKVVTTIARAFQLAGVPTVRFNFRGVGESNGSYGHAEGEIDDLAAVIAWVQATSGHSRISIAGFSFGSYISSAYVGRTPQAQVQQLISIAPPVENFPFADIPKIQCPWLVIQGDKDEVVASDKVTSWVTQRSEAITYIQLSQATHFFHGRLVELRQIIVNWLTQ